MYPAKDTENTFISGEISARYSDTYRTSQLVSNCMNCTAPLYRLSKMDTAIDIVLILNGIYDILCASSILWFQGIPPFSYLAQLHPTMFSEKENSENPTLKRFLAYWIMTYGGLRLTAGFHRDVALDSFAAATYFIEALCFENENRIWKTMVPSKVLFVSIFSVILGVWVLLRPIGVYDSIS